MPPEKDVRPEPVEGWTTFRCSTEFFRINAYETFVEGAKEGFGVAVQIIPYLIAMLIAISVFRSSGCMAYVIDAIRSAVLTLG